MWCREGLRKNSSRVNSRQVLESFGFMFDKLTASKSILLSNRSYFVQILFCIVIHAFVITRLHYCHEL